MKHILKKVIAIATVVTMLAAVPAMDAQAAVVKYATYTNTRFTYTVKYPTTFQRADMVPEMVPNCFPKMEKQRRPFGILIERPAREAERLS